MRGLAIIFGIILVALGILGSFPQMLQNGLLFNMLKVNWVANFLYILTGILGVAFGLTTLKGTRLYFQTVGVAYAIWAILGFVYGQNAIFGFIANNVGTAWLNVVFAVIALIIGFGTPQKTNS